MSASERTELKYPSNSSYLLLKSQASKCTQERGVQSRVVDSQVECDRARLNSFENCFLVFSHSLILGLEKKKKVQKQQQKPFVKRFFDEVGLVGVVSNSRPPPTQ